MLVTIFLTLVFITLLLVTCSVIYLVYLICEQSDDSSTGDSLAVDNEFSTTPSVSPVTSLNDPPGVSLQAQHRDTTHIANSESISGVSRPSPCGSHGAKVSSCTTSETPQAADTLDHHSTDTLHDDDNLNSYSSFESDPISSILKLDTTPGQEPEQHQDHTSSHTSYRKANEIDGWKEDVANQRSLLTNLLGQVLSKQLFDDFDPKDMALGGTGLHWCKSRKSIDKLLELGVPLEGVNRYRETALHVAVRRRKLPVAIGLLCHDADANCRNENGETPLIIAIRNNDIFACQLLLIFDADPNCTDLKGLSARHYAAIICDRNRKAPKRKLPSASNLILAMLDVMGALRCKLPPKNEAFDESRDKVAATKDANDRTSCADGCSVTGSYNGDCYKRWPDFSKESLYKRHMFSALIESILEKKKKDSGQRNNQHDAYEPSRLLCIDGGGMRGVIVCQILIELEKHLTKPIINYFDWIGGTSAGAYISCALCLGKTLRQLRRITFYAKDEVFSGTRPYNSKLLEKFFKRTFGASTKMSKIQGKKVAVTTVVADRDPCQLRLFRNYKSASDLLESHGFPAHRYNGMSGHSVVTRPPLADTVQYGVEGYDRGKSVKSPSNVNTGKEKTTFHDADSRISKGKTSAEIKRDDARESRKKSNTNSEADKSDDSCSFKNDYNNGSLIESVMDENEQDPLIWQAVRASSAAPFFFRPYGPFLDGGIISNNPTMDMLTEFHNRESVKRFLRANSVPTTDVDEICGERPRKLNLVLSLGTGRGRVVGREGITDFGHVATGLATVFSPVELLKSIRAARDLFKKVVQQSCQTEEHILDRAQAWCSSLSIPYFRLNPPLVAMFSIDDKRDEQLINALWQTKLYIMGMGSQVKELCSILEDNGQQVD